MVDKAASDEQFEIGGITGSPQGDADLVKMGTGGLVHMKSAWVKVHWAPLRKQFACRGPGQAHHKITAADIGHRTAEWEQLLVSGEAPP